MCSDVYKCCECGAIKIVLVYTVRAVWPVSKHVL